MNGIEIQRQKKVEYFADLEKKFESWSENFYNDQNYLLTQAHNNAIFDAIKEIEGWKNLEIKVFQEVATTNPVETKREHQNTLNLLNVIISKLKQKIL